MLRAVGMGLRSWGKSIDAMGTSLQGSAVYVEKLVPSARVVAHNGKLPTVAPNAFIAPSASLIGQVSVGEGSGIWYNSVLRGDQSSITLGTNSTVQERAVISSTSPTVIGNNCVIGVGAQLSGCTLKDNTLVGVGASVESGAIIEQGAVVAAGSVVGSNVTIPAGQLWSGNPVAYLRDLTAAESDALAASAHELAILGAHHGEETDKSIEAIEDEHEAFKESLARGGDTIMNPSPNFFEDRPGAIWKQEGTGDVTYQSVDQKTIDGRTFNRMREYDVEITRAIAGLGKTKTGKEALSVDADPEAISKQLKGGRPI